MPKTLLRQIDNGVKDRFFTMTPAQFIQFNGKFCRVVHSAQIFI